MSTLHKISLLSKPVLSGSLLLGIVASTMMLSYSTKLTLPDLVTLKKEVMAQLIQMPLNFEFNKGQTADEVKYLSRATGYQMYFTPKEIVLDFRSTPIKANTHGKFKDLPVPAASNDVLRVSFVGANNHPVIAGKGEVITKSNYLIGNDPKKWQTDISNYSGVNYHGLYRGIDMAFYGNQNKLEYDIIVNPGANPSQPRLHFTGAKKLHLNPKGDLIITTPEGRDVSMHNPIIYQTIAGKKQSIKGHFNLFANNEVGFNVGSYDKTKPLIIDPVVTFSTYIGGSGGDNAALAITIGTGIFTNTPVVFLTGYTNSTDFPTLNPYQATNKGKGRTAWILKYNRSLNSIIYSTYLGGSGGNDEGFCIALDSNTAAYVGGETNSSDFPTTSGAFQTTDKGAKDFTGFVTKLNPEGNGLVYSTYLGGSGENQEVNGIAVDSQGFAYVTGETTSSDFPLQNPFQATNKGPKFTAYVTKFNTLGNALVYSTYLGGSGGQDEGNGIKVDDVGDVYLTGDTNSKDFPVLNAIQPTPKPAGAARTGFVTKMTAAGDGLVWSTYLGGSGGNDYPNALDLDDLQNVYIVGYTNSSDFPIKNAFQTTNKGPNFTGFVTKILATGAAIDYSTYFGGSGGNDQLTCVSVDPQRHPHFGGFTNSTDYPIANGVQPVKPGPGLSGTASSLGATGGLVNSSYIGGSGGNDRVYGVVMDAISTVYNCGLTNSADFPLVDPIQSTKTSTIMAWLRNVSL